jgi:hypothetical protein
MRLRGAAIVLLASPAVVPVARSRTPHLEIRADELLAKIRAEWDRAPVVKELDGASVRLPGFMVMLEGTPNPHYS